MTAKSNALSLSNLENNWHPNCLNFTLFLFLPLCYLLWLFVITAGTPQSLHTQAKEIIHKPAGSGQQCTCNPLFHHTSSELGLAYCFSQPQQPTATLHSMTDLKRSYFRITSNMLSWMEWLLFYIPCFF